MLACSQDIYFHNDMNVNYQSVIHDPAMLTMQQQGSASDIDKKMQLQQRDNSIMNTTSMDDISNISAGKDREEQVWPPDVEAAFIEALESIPKLGRRKILVNGKPCGRNELISDFIFRKTSKIRTRKQVSSHIQVLKNTRKGDAHFMRLLTDSVETDDKIATNGRSNGTNNNPKAKGKQIHVPYSLSHHGIKATGPAKMKTYQSLDSLSSDDSSTNSSPSPNDYMLDLICADPSQQQVLNMLQLKDFYDPMQHLLVNSMGGAASSMNLFDNTLITDPFFGSTNADIITPLIADETLGNTSILSPTSNTENMTEEELLMSSLNMLKKKSRKMNKKTKQQQQSIESSSNSTLSQFALWPNYLCLYLEYTLAYDPCRPISHNLSQLSHCYANCIPNVSSNALPKEKCPPLANYGLTPQKYPLLLAKTKLDLNLTISDFVFNNTFFFEAQVRRTIECTTTIYSFGNVVLESKEVQQALWVSEGKYMYNFVFVNQFFDAFMKGIRSLQSWEEVDIAVNNLCIVQSFDDIETKHAAAKSPSNENEITGSLTPLLVMVYEFERGNGVIDISLVENGNKLAADMESTFDFLESNI